MAEVTIRLISKEGEEFTVEKEFCKMCNLVKATLEDNDEWLIPLDSVSSKHIEWIIDFCRRRKLFSTNDSLMELFKVIKLLKFLADNNTILFR